MRGKEALVQWIVQQVLKINLSCDVQCNELMTVPQIDRARRNKITPWRRMRLEDLGVYLETDVSIASHTEWTQRMEELRTFRKQHGHCR